MIEKRIELCIGTDRQKFVRARLSLLVIDTDNPDVPMAEHYHSINVAPGDDLARIRAANEAHLADPKGGIPGAPWPKIPDDAWADFESHLAIVHTPAVVTAFKARVAAAQAADAERAKAAKPGA